jgi:hypothetical protein
VRRSLAAGAKLAALRALCAEPTRPPNAGPAGRERLTNVLHSLVDEGTPEEAPLLRRAAELRAIVEAGEASAAAPVGWDGDAGDPCELLRTDAFQTASPGLAEAARQAGRGWLLTAATGLAELASTNAPSEVTLTLAGSDVRVRETGGDSWDLSRVRGQIEQRPVVDPRADRITLILAIVGGVLLLPVFGWPNPLAVVSTLTGCGVLIAAGVRWARERQDRYHRQAQKQSELANVDKQVTRVMAELTELRQAVADTAKAASADLAEIRARLPE